MLKLMVAATESNSGKTAITCGLLSLFKKRSFKTCSFKCGPDYIDPMFHKTVLGIESGNLDVFLAGEEGVRRSFAYGSSGFDVAICEGVMGYYDGMTSDSPEGSAWHLADMLKLPTLLVLRPKGSALTLAAVVKGMDEFRKKGSIKAVVFDESSKVFCEKYGTAVERETGIPVIGYLPHMEEADFESRHLGLMTAGEIDDLKERISVIAKTMEETIDVNKLIYIMDDGNSNASGKEVQGAESNVKEDGVHKARIAVARDEAFNFIYGASIDAMEMAGAKIEYFSPIRDKYIPEGVGGLYIPGGYPELYARELSENETMRKDMLDKIEKGMPVIAECGGFLYLSKSIEDEEENTWPMVGVFDGHGSNAGHIVRFGYGHIEAREDSMLFRKGERIPEHEFHYWDSSELGSDLTIHKLSDDSSHDFGYANSHMYAGFPHLYLGGEPNLAQRFVDAAIGLIHKTI